MTDRLPVKTRKISTLEPAEINPRKISDSELEKLKNSLEQWGMVEPLVWNTRTDRLIGGHQRLAAAAELGWEEVPVLYVDLPPDEAAALNLALNKLGGDWDKPALGQILATLEPYLVELAGFDPDDLEPAGPGDEAEIVQFQTKGHAWTAQDDHRVRCPRPAGKCPRCKELQEVLG